MFVSDFYKHHPATISIVFTRVMTLCASENQAQTDTQKSRQLQGMSDLKNFHLNCQDIFWKNIFWDEAVI